MSGRLVSLTAIALSLTSCGNSEPDWPAALKDQIASAECNDGQFTLLERDESLTDYLYVVRIDGPECITSLRQSLAKAGARESDVTGVSGLLLPGNEDRNDLLIAFDFTSLPGSAIWTMDKT